MTTWTPAAQQSETWTAETQPIRVFSRDIFSHEFYTGKRVFSLGSAAGIWDEPAQQAEIWVAA